MESEWTKDLKKRIVNFYKEFKTVCDKCGRDPKDVQILYVTKYLNSEQFVMFIDIMKQFDGGKILIGENRVQDAAVKFSLARAPLARIKKMLIGNLQTNKINKAIEIFDEIHSIDSVDLAKALNARLQKEHVFMTVYLELNISGELQKHGFHPDQIDIVMNTMKAFVHIKVDGFMTMAPITSNISVIRNIFRKLRTLADRYQLKTSMGMSNDWKIAVEEGSDMVRIGSRLFA